MSKMKYCIINKRTLIIIMSVTAILIAAIVTAITSQTAAPAAAASRKLPIYCVQKEKKQISISFDAAWGNEDTQDLINTLAKYNVKTTFFVVGQWVDKYPESVKALHDAGHEIMNHSNTHPHMPKLSRDEMINEINGCNDKIAKITGVKPILFRAPYGDYDNNLIDVINSLGMYCIQWDVDSLDWKDKTPEQIIERVTKHVQNGSICLFHNAAKYTPQALGPLLEKLQKDGYEIVPISQLIMKENYTINSQGRQIPQTGLMTTTVTSAAPTAQTNITTATKK